MEDGSKKNVNGCCNIGGDGWTWWASSCYSRKIRGEFKQN